MGQTNTLIDKDNYLKKELYELIKQDECIFDFIQLHALDGLWYWDIEKPENEWMNPRFWTVLGYDPDEMPHQSSAWQNIINQDDLQVALENFRKHCEDPNHPYDQIVRYSHKNGSTIWIRCRGMAIRNQEGKPVRMLGAHHDITALKNTEAELIKAKEQAEENEAMYRQKHELLSLFIKHSPIYTFIKSIEPDCSRVVYVSDNYENMIGISGEKMIGKTMHDLFPPEFAEKMTADDLKTVDNGEILSLDEELNDKNYLTIKYPIIQKQQKLLAGYTIDITERIKSLDELKKAKEKAEENEAKYISFFNSTETSNSIFDRDCILRLQNQKSIETFGRSGIGQNVFELFGKKKGQIIYERMQRVFQTGVTETFETEFDLPTGTNWSRSTYIPVYDDKKEIVSIQVISHNITELKKTQIELIKAKEKAEESDRLKTAFLQNMSHEIRTPLNAIIGFSNLLPEYLDDPEALQMFAKIIDQRCNDLLNIFNEILYISKIEAGESTLHVCDFNLNELFTDLSCFFKNYQNLTQKQNIDFSIQPVDDERIARIKTDKIKLKQILINLIDNAFKYTEAGSIKCDCRLDKDKLLFHVADTGVGIPKEKHEIIFERFFRIQDKSKLIGGTGLGLSIVKGLVELLGGQVWLESQCNKGSSFFFTIDYVRSN